MLAREGLVGEVWRGFAYEDGMAVGGRVGAIP